jgi:hypothetical protein
MVSQPSSEGIVTSEFEKDGPLEARPIDEDEYPKQIEAEYRNRTLPGIVINAAHLEEKPKICGMSPWIIIW